MVECHETDTVLSIPRQVFNTTSECHMSEFERRCNLWGWVLFVVCAAFFIASAWRSHDMLYLVGSVVFLVACLVFLVPFVKKRSDRRQ